MDTMVADALVGRTVDRRYRVDARLAAGGMATVYRATDLRLDRPVALKVMKQSLADDPDFVSRFHAEARAAARLSHPHVVGVFDQGETDGLIYLAMEYVPGRTVRDLLNEFGAMAPEQALAILDQALQALGAAHDAGFVHRDIKPENVLVSDTGVVKVTDFGLARTLAGSAAATSSGVLIGTAAYLAPEQVAQGVSDQRSDVYQAGVLLYELLTAVAPHTGDNPWAVAYQHVNADVPAPSARRPGLPGGLDALVADATVRDPAFRMASVPEFLGRLRAVAATLPRPAPFPRRTTVIVPDTTTQSLHRPHEQPTPALDLTRFDAPSGFPVAGGTEAEAAADAAAGAPPRRRLPRISVPRWRPRRRTVLLALAAALLAAAFGAAWVQAGGNPLIRTDVPAVTGVSEQRALTVLERAGFQATVTDRVFSEEVAAGIVIAADPESGSSAATGADIGLVISLGPERYEVPKVRGLSPADATAALAATNLIADDQVRRYSDTVAEGAVIATRPKHGAEVKRDTLVQLRVSRGPAPVDVPAVVGVPRSAAVDQLAAAGLTADISTAESTTVPRGVVISVEPRAGATVLRGDTVQVLVSKGPPPVAMPNVVDQPRDEAVATLEALGLKVRVDEGIVTPLGRVYSQDPPPGTTVPVGSTVTLSIF